MNTERVAQNRLCMDKGGFAGDFAKTSACPQRKAKYKGRGGGNRSSEKCSHSDFENSF